MKHEQLHNMMKDLAFQVLRDKYYPDIGLETWQYLDNDIWESDNILTRLSWIMEDRLEDET